MNITKWFSAFAIALSFGCAMPAGAQEDIAAFYKDKQLRIVVGSAAGSGYDLNARLFAKYFQRYVPGKPTIIIQNQPGAGSATMASALYNTAPRDGTVMGGAINGMPTLPLLAPEQARFDPTKFNWLGSTNRDTQVTYVWENAPVQSLADLQTKELVVGATTPGTTQVDFPVVARSVLGLKFKVISGYEGTTDIHVAMERGEVQAMGANGWLSLKALKSDWIRDRKVRIIMQYGQDKNPELPDVPTVFSLAKTDADRQALLLIVSRLEYGRPFFLPPEVPAARVEALRRAFDASVKDPEYLAEAEKQQLEVSPMTGEDVAALIRKVAQTPPDIVARVRAALESGGK
jgi:tripartite-type tricarboxylate transporter receptor subunit TctC